MDNNASQFSRMTIQPLIACQTSFEEPHLEDQPRIAGHSAMSAENPKPPSRLVSDHQRGASGDVDDNGDADASEAAAAAFGIDRVLYDAVRNPKQRLFMLKLEADCESFVSNKSSDLSRRLDYPDLNSFRRLIVHRVGELFGLERIVEPRRQAVILCLGPDSKLPTLRLCDIPYEPGQDQGDVSDKPLQATRIILRHSKIRTPQSQSGQRRSKTSDNSHSIVGEDTDDKRIHSSGSKTENLSIREREALYQEARARIFDETEGEPTESITSVSPQSRPGSKFQERQFNPRPPPITQNRQSWIPPTTHHGPYSNPSFPTMPLYRPPFPQIGHLSLLQQQSQPVHHYHQYPPPQFQHPYLGVEQQYRTYTPTGSPGMQYPYYSEPLIPSSISTNGTTYYCGSEPFSAHPTPSPINGASGIYYESASPVQIPHGHAMGPLMNSNTPLHFGMGSIPPANPEITSRHRDQQTEFQHQSRETTSQAQQRTLTERHVASIRDDIGSNPTLDNSK
ncbi:hypothetical protein BSLG_010658 [Batrachochytrium salamandrivorans]|nr:hypothetical protein BSLG_010658 [Batrachochytrium salamandrivorans]